MSLIHIVVAEMPALQWIVMLPLVSVTVELANVRLGTQAKIVKLRQMHAKFESVSSADQACVTKIGASH